MNVNREFLLELDKKRTKIEDEILELTNYLNSDGMPGIDGKLIDNEGFPIQNLDILGVRTARNKLIILQNDLTSLMHSIEENMKIYFKSERENQNILNSQSEKLQDPHQPISISISVDKTKSQQNQIKLPFAWISIVESGSPAEEAGLKEGDGITIFDYLVYGMTNNPLQKIAEIVGKNINTIINVEVVRTNENELNGYIQIKLIPHKWQGQGVLGCKLNLAK